MNIDTPYNLRLTENINFAQENSTQITMHHTTLLSAIHVKVSFLNTLNPRTAKEAGKRQGKISHWIKVAPML